MFKKLLQALCVVIGVLFISTLLFTLNAEAASVDSLIVLIPDGFESQDDPRADTWVDAASEEGVRLEFMHDSDFMALGTRALKYSGFVMPDQIHQKASDELIAALKSYVSQGGKLMLVYDAGALTSKGVYPSNPVITSPLTYSSRFGDLAGVDYLFYEEFHEAGTINKLVGLGPVLGVEKMLWQLQVPPGKSMPFAGLPVRDMPTYVPANEYDPGGLKIVTLDHDDDANKVVDKQRPLPIPVAASTEVHQISGYANEVINYKSFVTRNRGDHYAGDVLLSSPRYGLVAGLNSVGAGKVLFVNLSLSYLKGQTDGMLMHGFMHYFANTMLGLPRLANHPKGIGGLVFNWHVDYRKPVEVNIGQLDKQGVWDRGPYSIHFTAGPDVNYAGDGLGMDLPNNLKAQTWVRYLDQKGHQVASHGGWIHNYYGSQATEDNGADFKQYLVLNHEAVDAVLGRKTTEYSAPLGNNPLWAMDWLQDYGIRGYYFAGDTGMGPTRAYREGKPTKRGMWAFPVSPLGQYATFEEFSKYGVGNAEITRWYAALMDFAVYNHTSRLIYAHPPGAVGYPEVIQALLDRADAYQDNGIFKWYTMTDLANFMNNRAQVSWQVTEDALGRHRFSANHPASLKDQTWMLPKRCYNQPKVVLGKADVLKDALNWIVIAKDVTDLQFDAKKIKGHN
ncbi:MAG: hypothetical protein HY272_10455 [Gammaproteobacteria bacterium]|nr:hypothetical protein [Gammaproteobacteria bacterium]